MRPTPSEPGAPIRNRSRDDGYTLTEMLVATVLMGTVVLAIVGGMWAVVRASQQNDERAKVQAVLGAAADSVVSYLHVYCPQRNNVYLGYAQDGAEAVGWDESSVQIIRYQYWNPDIKDWQDTNTIQEGETTCSDTVGYTVDRTLQKLTIQVTSPTGQYKSSMEIVKSDVRAEES
jgi:type II secretory pathway component PulJ